MEIDKIKLHPMEICSEMACCIAYCIKYNETPTTYETLYGNREWFYEHFIRVLP